MKDKRHSILIVDDVSQNIQIVAGLLGNENYRIFFATSGEQALSALNKNKIDLVLLDIMMPVMDGLEVCRIIKQDEKLKEIPVIFLTAKADMQDILTGFEIGAEDYIIKPFQRMELLARVKTHLELKSSRDRLKQYSIEQNERLHMLSHDVTNSLTGIPLMAGLLEMAESPEDKEKYIHLINQSVENGLAVIDLVKKIQSIEEKPLILQPLHLKGCIEKSLSLLDQTLHKKELSIEIDVPDELHVLSEEITFINSVVNNVISNAIKFSSRGGKIIIHALPLNDRIFLQIRDFGIGIPEEMLAGLFDVKKNNSRKGTEGESGTGFGMSLIRKFMKAYGGSIEVQSPPEGDKKGGTRIILDLLNSDLKQP